MKINFDNSIDEFSIGHIVFGLMTNWIIGLIFQFEVSYIEGIYLSPLSILIFVGWEILEHTLIYKFIYKKALKNWSESKENSIMDILIAASSFYISFIIFYILIYNILVLIINLIITTFSIPIIILIMFKLNKNKKTSAAALEFNRVYKYPLDDGSESPISYNGGRKTRK